MSCPKQLKDYVLGFLFSEDRKSVVLIEKKRPAWQAGRLNGLGGKLEPTDISIYDGMAREFCEEAGVTTPGKGTWRHVLTMRGDSSRVYVFRAFGDVTKARTCEDEQVLVVPTDALPANVLPNLRWLVPLLSDPEVNFNGEAFHMNWN